MQTGASHASQKFFLDGYVIEVRKTGVHQYIRIEGKQCKFAMESGLLDAPFWQTSGYTSQGNFKAAVYYETTKTKAYHARFTEVVKPVVGSSGRYRTNPGTGSAGQFAGEVVRQAGFFKGTIHTDSTSRAVRPKQVVEDANADPRKLVDAGEDSAVSAKKELLSSYPGSVFTGRCRLWVQAMHGLYLYDEDGNLRMPLSVQGSGLMVEPHKFVSDGADPATKSAQQLADEASYNTPVNLPVSTGVWLDGRTGKHWMFAPGYDVVMVYPLIADSCGEAARHFLRDGDKTHPGEDKKRLEAYILSTSRPDKSKARKHLFGLVAGGWPLYYGWHWNYTGNRADMALNTAKKRPTSDWFGLPIMESTHWMLKMTAALTDAGTAQEDTLFTFTSLRVDGPSEWMVDRGMHCVVGPSGGEYMEKMIPGRGTPYGDLPWVGSGTFYVFYTGDELQACKIAVSYVPGEGGTVRSSDFQNIWGPGQTNLDFYLKGVGGTGYYEKSRQVTRHWKIKISCGKVSVDELLYGKKEYGIDRTEGSGASVGARTTNYFTSGPNNGTGLFVPVGIPQGTARGWRYTMVFVNMDNGDTYDYGLATYGRWTLTRSRKDTTFVSTAVVVVPQKDAEAVFIKTYKGQTNEFVFNIRSLRESVVKEHTVVKGGSFDVEVWRNNWAGTVSETNGPSREEIVTEEISKVVCNRGGAEVDQETMKTYQQAVLRDRTEDGVYMYAPCVSGTGGDCAVIADAVKQAGYETRIKSPVLVGWE